MPQKDKLEHFAVSFFLASTIYWLTHNQLLTIFFVTLIGSLKEYYDQRRKKNTAGQSMLDVLADVLDMVSGILLVRYLF